jgi:hypothetical protein
LFHIEKQTGKIDSIFIRLSLFRGLSYEKDLENVDEFSQILALIRAVAAF